MFAKKLQIIFTLINSIIIFWGISSFGRAPALHAEGDEFESRILHNFGIIMRVC